MHAPRERRWRILYKIAALKAQDGICKYCCGPLTIAQATADHKWPVSRNGRTTAENIVAACFTCNRVKGAMSHIEFYRLIDRRMPRGASPAILVIWASRRIWKRTWRAVAQIEKLAK